MIVVVICLIIAAIFMQKAKNEVDEYVEGDTVYEQIADMAIDSSKKDIEKSVEKVDSFEEADITEDKLTDLKTPYETLSVDFEKLKSFPISRSFLSRFKIAS